MDIKLIALDLDRTTLNAQGKLSKENKEAIQAAVAKGIHVCIASGRAFDTLPESIVSIPGIEYAITSNGAAVYKIQNKQCLRSYLLKEESVREIIRLTKDRPVTYEGFIRGRAYASKEYIENPVKFGATPHAVAYVQATRNFKEDIVGFLLKNAAQLDSMDIVVKDIHEKERIIKLLSDNVSDIYITSSISQLVEVSYKDAGKRSGVQFIAEYLGISREEIAAFGDADNDIDMLEYAGFGIAVKNASDRAIEAADYVTLHHDESGVAYALRNILKCI
ncbi:MAG: HAD family phosphatase [Lachnospira sp.]|nr:HAD family phosphatase [Lachnospira sp.]